MSVVVASGTQTAVIGTEYDLATFAAPAAGTAKTRLLIVGMAAMVAGDTVRLRAKGAVLPGGTEELIREVSFPGPMYESNGQGLPCVMTGEGRCTLTQTAGTGRAFPWSIVALD